MKTLLAIFLIMLSTQVESAIRVIPCQDLDCTDNVLTKRVSLSVASKLPEGNHKIYFYNVDTKNTFLYSVNKFYEAERKRMLIRARGPFASTATMEKYIVDVYQLESSPYTAIGIPAPGNDSVRFGESTYHGVNAYMLNGFWHWPLTISTLGAYPFASSAWAGGMTSTLFTQLLNTARLTNPGLTSDQLIDALNSSMGTVLSSNQSNQSVGFGSTAGIGIGPAGATVDAKVERMDGSTSSFSFNVLAPSMGLIYPDGMVVMAWNPKKEEFEITHVIDADGNIIEFTDGKLDVDTSQVYKISSVSADIWISIIEAMGIRNARDMALLNKLKNLKEGYVRICGGVGFPPCPAT